MHVIIEELCECPGSRPRSRRQCSSIRIDGTNRSTALRFDHPPAARGHGEKADKQEHHEAGRTTVYSMWIHQNLVVNDGPGW
jgi:hypothetical protein